jgi:phosphopentomutase/2,3-bisphosphoglycerate-independent phosphoglycerate mutase family metalloenzyme
MKYRFLPFAAMLLSFYCSSVQAQPPSKTQNIFIITTDGFRWQEIFNGADKELLCNPQYVKDTALAQQLFWDSTATLRRKKLMPFLWNVIAANGQVYGNRFFGNKADVTNWYKISYPGYNEMLTGFADPFFIPNIPINNRNTTVLEYLNTTENYAGKIVAFTSWNIFPYIFNEKRSKLPLNSGYSKVEENGDSVNKIINEVQSNVVHKKNTRYDMLTYLSAKEYIGEHHPKIVFLGLGETDEFAHEGRYDLYLQQASNVDRMIAELWYFVQTDPFYKNNTTFIITTDHGRGSNPSSWFTHGIFTKGSGNTWLAVMGPDIKALGEMKNEEQTYQKQLAPTIAMLAGEKFMPIHASGKKIILPIALTRSNISIEKNTQAAVYTNTNFFSNK